MAQQRLRPAGPGFASMVIEHGAGGETAPDSDPVVRVVSPRHQIPSTSSGQSRGGDGERRATSTLISKRSTPSPKRMADRSGHAAARLKSLT